MALPPKGLTTLLAQATAPAAMHAALRTHGCLSWRARLVPARVLACIDAALAEHRRASAAPGWAGPSRADAVAAALARAPYLNARGRRLHAAAG